MGHTLSAKGIAPDPSKVEAVSSYPLPQNPKELKQFLGLSNYYRQFIPNYANITEPLNKLLCNDQQKFKFQWDVNCQTAFNLLKSKLTTAPILSFPDFTVLFIFILMYQTLLLVESLASLVMAKKLLLVIGVGS